MPDIPPYQRLDPNAQEWGRWVTDSAQSNKSAIESLQTNTRSANQSLAAQLNRLQLQVSDLSERKTYYASSDPNAFIFRSSPASLSYIEALRIPFSLKTRRIVTFQGITTYDSTLAITSPQSIQGFASLLLEVYTASDVFTGISSGRNARTGHTNSASGTIETRSAGTIVSSVTAALDPGDYYARFRIGSSVAVSGGTYSISFSVGGNDTNGTVIVTDPA